MSDHFRMAQRIGHPRGKQPPTLDEYCAMRHVIVSQQAAFHTPIDDVLATLSRTREVAMAVPSYNQVALVLAQTDCVATLPSRVLDRYTSIVDVIDAPFDIPTFQLAMAWHPRAQQDESLRWLREQFLDAVRPHAPA
jgi:DNA-binding transcriptional LysR family regulator